MRVGWDEYRRIVKLFESKSEIRKLPYRGEGLDREASPGAAIARATAGRQRRSDVTVVPLHDGRLGVGMSVRF